MSPELKKAHDELNDRLEMFIPISDSFLKYYWKLVERELSQHGPDTGVKRDS